MKSIAKLKRRHVRGISQLVATSTARDGKITAPSWSSFPAGLVAICGFLDVVVDVWPAIRRQVSARGERSPMTVATDLLTATQKRRASISKNTYCSCEQGVKKLRGLEDVSILPERQMRWIDKSHHHQTARASHIARTAALPCLTPKIVHRANA
jgi:hypothetical protein